MEWYSIGGFMLPDQLFINHSNSVYQPIKNTYAGGSLLNDSLFLKKGDRFRQKISFKTNDLLDSFVVLTNGLLTKKSESLLLSQKMVKIQ